jgi:hypothetical protein
MKRRCAAITGRYRAARSDRRIAGAFDAGSSADAAAVMRGFQA